MEAVLDLEEAALKVAVQEEAALEGTLNMIAKWSIELEVASKEKEMAAKPHPLQKNWWCAATASLHTTNFFVKKNVRFNSG